MSVFFIDSSKRAPLLPHKSSDVASQPPAAPLPTDRPISRHESEADNIGWGQARLLILLFMPPANHNSLNGFSLLESGESMALTFQIGINI